MRRARELLTTVGLGDRLRHRPAELSGGEQQRVALARAMVNQPVLILADEPTGNLDSASGERVLEALEQMRRETGTTLVASLVLALLSTTALAWWYYEWRFHGNENWRCTAPCGLPVGTSQVWYDYVERLWHCHDGSGNCYATGTYRSSPRWWGCAYC